MENQTELQNEIEGCIAALARLFAHRGASTEVAVLALGKTRCEVTGYDNWDGGTDIHTITIELPPPLYAQVADRALVVEIFVTHAVTDAKRKWLEENDLPMVEFDFSAADRTIGKADLKRAFLQPRRPIGDGSSKWIHHPKAGSDQEAVNSEFRANYLDRLKPLVVASDPAAQAACRHELELTEHWEPPSRNDLQVTNRSGRLQVVMGG